MGFLLSENKIKKLYVSTQNSGCIASNRITVDGMKVGYMYRESPSSTFPDSGWRFFAGDESEEYTDNPDNFHIFDLNTICNYDRDIIQYLDTKENVALIRNKNIFILDI